MTDGATEQLQISETPNMEDPRDTGGVLVSLCDVAVEPEIPERRRWQRFRADSACYIPATICIVCLTALTIIIVLSAQLSRVTQRYGDTSVSLEMLRQERGHLTSDNEMRDDAVRVTEETFRQTNQDLEITGRDPLRAQEDQNTTKQDQGRTIEEEVRSTVTTLEDRARDTGCHNHSRQEPNMKVNRLPRDPELSMTRRTLQRLQGLLQKSQNNLQEQLKKLNDLEQKLSALEANLRTLEDKLGERDKKSNQEDNVGPACPRGWKPIDDMCYYFSSERKVRIKAVQDCKKMDSTLAKIQESDSTLKTLVEKDGRSFWVGLAKINNVWKWWDDCVEENFKPKTKDWCAMASPDLKSQPCATPLPWICQKAAS